MTYSNGSIKWIFGTSSCLKWKNFSTASLGLDFSVSLRLSLGCNITQRLWNTGLGPAFFRYLFRSQTSPNSQCISTLNSLNDPLNWLCSFSPDHPLYGFFILWSLELSSFTDGYLLMAKCYLTWLYYLSIVFFLVVVCSK